MRKGCIESDGVEDFYIAYPEVMQMDGFLRD